jgi:hypothetical protein
MKYLYLAIFLLFLASCDKNDPTPETSDEIYKDYQTELEISEKTLEAEQKGFQKLLDEKSKAVPQTGQIKYVQKKINDAEKWIESLKQQRQFFQIKLELRKAEVRKKYIESKRGGKPWPDQAEIEIYRSTIKLQRDKINWDKNKGIKKNVPRGTDQKSSKPIVPAED